MTPFVIALFLMVFFYGAAMWYKWKLGAANEVIEKTSQECAEQRLRVSSVCNNASLHLSQFHPEVDIICKAIETAFLDDCLPDVEKLAVDLAALRKGGRS